LIDPFADNQSWRLDAACTGTDTDLFFPDARGAVASVNAAKELCAKCPVCDYCLEYAMLIEHRRGEYRNGVWGGLSVRERYRIADAWAAERYPQEGNDHD